MAEVELMPAQRVPRTAEEAHWLKQLREAYPVRHRSRMHARWARKCARCLREWRAVY